MHVWTFGKINVYGFSSYRFTAIVKRRGMHILKIVKTAAFCKIKKRYENLVNEGRNGFYRLACPTLRSGKSLQQMHGK